MSHPELVIFWKRLIRTRLAITTDVIEHKKHKVQGNATNSENTTVISHPMLVVFWNIL